MLASLTAWKAVKMLLITVRIATPTLEPIQIDEFVINANKKKTLFQLGVHISLFNCLFSYELYIKYVTVYLSLI